MKAVSTLVMILLVLCSLVVGALLSYMWVMSGYYYEASGTDLIITEALFPLEHADYFNVTVMNPTHSSTTNITDIYIKAEDSATIQYVTDTYPESFPILIERATSQTIMCIENWSPFAGKSITVYITTDDNTEASKTVTTQSVKMEIETAINPSISSKRFNITVTNLPESNLNLTLARVLVNQMPVLNVTPTLPLNLTVGDNVTVACIYDLENLGSSVISVETAEGYHAELTTNVAAELGWYVAEVLFNVENPDDMNITIFNPDTASTFVDINSIELVYGNTTSCINGSLTDPPFVPYYRLAQGETVTFDHCTWNWGSYRSQNVTVNVYDLQEFAPATLTVGTPEPVNFKVTDLDFNLADTGHFTINISDAASSTEAITPAQIRLNSNNASFKNQTIPIGKTIQFACTLDWSSLRGTTATVNVSIANGQYFSRDIALPSVDLTISDAIGFNTTTEGFVYVNMTITNSALSIRDVTITDIILATPNSTDHINATIPLLAPNGYPLAMNTGIAVVCPWYWKDYYNQTLTITVKTAEGFTATKTFPIPASTP
jgi:hypothetical protein